MHQFMGMWLNPNSRGSRLRIWQPWGCNSLHAHHFTATGFSGNSRPRRLKIAEPSGCKSRVADRRVVRRELADRFGSNPNSLGSASLPTPTNLKSPRRSSSSSNRTRTERGGFPWNVNRTSEPGLGANECVPAGKWRKSTTFRHFPRLRPDSPTIDPSIRRKPDCERPSIRYRCWSGR